MITLGAQFAIARTPVVIDSGGDLRRSMSKRANQRGSGTAKIAIRHTDLPVA
jgi:hypothetical protein